MPLYQIRFLKPDDTYAKAMIEQEFPNDTAATDFAREHYPQKALEIWDGERRTARRVSGAHEARIKGIYRSSCRYPALSQWSLQNLEKQYGPLPFADFEQMGKASIAVFIAFKTAMARHPVWIRAQGHPAAPPTVPEIRISFHPSVQNDAGWRGSTVISVFSQQSDGEAIIHDIMDAAHAAAHSAHSPESGIASVNDDISIQPVWPHAAKLTGHLTVDWTIGR